MYQYKYSSYEWYEFVVRIYESWILRGRREVGRYGGSRAQPTADAVGETSFGLTSGGVLGRLEK